MSEYDNSNRLALWFNDKREKQTHPHLKGQGEAGQEMWVSAWFTKDLNEDDAKTLMGIVKRHASNCKSPFISVSLTPKEQNKPNPAEHHAGAVEQKNPTYGNDQDFDDDIAF